MSIKKYFWSLKPEALKEVKEVLKDSRHPKFVERLFTLLSRCDSAKEVFSAVNKKDFIENWPRVRRYWPKSGGSADFKAWWETIYEQLLRGTKADAGPKGRPSRVFSKIGRLIKEERIRQKVTQHDFARRAGMTQPDISAIEAGKKNITMETFIRLSRLLGIKNLPLD